MRRARALALLASAAALSAALSSVSSAEVSQKNGVRVSVKGEITAASADVLPQLQHLSIAINSAGHLDVKGIPHCWINHINPSTNQEALEACRSSLVGEGTFSANVVLPEQS